MRKSFIYVYISAPVLFIVLLYSFCFFYPIKNTFAQIIPQDNVYQDPSFGIKINYPADWKADSDEADPKAEKSTIVTFFPKINLNDTDVAVKVWVNNNPPTYNLQSFLQNEINNYRKNDASYTFGGSTIDTVTLAGYPAFTHSYTTKVNGQEITNYEIGSIINGKAYEITYYAKSDEFPINLPIAYRIINSFVVIPSSSSPTSENGNGSSTPAASGGIPNNDTPGSSSNNNNPSSPQSPLANTFNPIIQLNQFGNNQSGPNSKGTIQSGNKTKESPRNQSLTSNPATVLPNNNSPNPNQPPVANAGINQQVNSGFIVLLNGSQSYDPDNDPITYLWRQIAGPAVKLDDATSNTPSFTAPSVSTNSNLIFELTVKDNKDVKGTSIVTITDKPFNTTTTVSLPNTTQQQPQQSQQPQSSSQQATLTTNLTYTNPTYGISINYPSDWTKEEGAGTMSAATGPATTIVTFVPTKYVYDTNNTVFLMVIINTQPKSDLKSILKDELSTDKNTFKKVHVISSDTQSTLAGQPAYSFTISANDEGSPSKILETGRLVGNSEYYIQYEADSDKYDTYLPAVQNMISSFKVTNKS